MARGRYIGDHYFGGDARVSAKKTKPKVDKLDSAISVWSEAYPNVKFPNWYGSAFYAYGELKKAGYKYSTRYGWRKSEATNVN